MALCPASYSGAGSDASVMSDFGMLESPLADPTDMPTGPGNADADRKKNTGNKAKYV